MFWYGLFVQFAFVLISTYWNVNNKITESNLDRQKVLISTYWNVNTANQSGSIINEKF